MNEPRLICDFPSGGFFLDFLPNSIDTENRWDVMAKKLPQQSDSIINTRAL